ncbi:hypothetical protein [Spirillospora sp. NPDC048819]|uniref:hypothetical protein n=1 Tax=Spirillospora sp. NPDC048819 TaxID=3155268 RepID=UPI003404179F
MGVEDNTGTDTRTETTDKPATSERQWTPPPDNPGSPGSPGQPSRRESIARARQDQLENGSPQASQSTEISPKPAQERDDKPASPQTGNQSEKAEASGTPEAQDKEHDRDDGKPGAGQGGQRDGREQEPASQDDRSPTGGKPDTATTGDRDRPQTTSAEQGTDTRTEPADKPATSERQWTPPPDNPGSPGQPSRRESLARARQDQMENAQQTEGTDTSSGPAQEHNDQPTSAQPEDDGVNTPAAGKAEAADSEHDANRPATDEGGPESGEATRQDETGTQTQPRDAGTPASSTIGTDAPGDPAVGEPESRERPAEPPPDSEQNPQTADGSPDDGQRTQPESAEQPATPGNGAQDGEPGNRHTPDNAAASPQEADQAPGEPELHGDQDDDRDRKAEKPESSEPADQNNPPDRDTDQSGETEEPGRELAPHEASSTEVEVEPRRFQGHVTIPVDSDGRPIPSSRDTGNDTPDHGEPRRPEDDPASRDYQESDPDNPSRGREGLRRFLNKANDAKDATNKYSEPAQQNLERVQPTGQLSGARPNTDQVGPLHQSGKVGDATLGAVSTVIVLTQIARHGINLARQTRRREHADN